MAQNIASLVRMVGHPSLRKPCFNLNVNKIKTHEVQLMFDQLLDCMKYFGCASLSAPQIGMPYNFFAMETIFYEDFNDDKSEFERLFDLTRDETSNNNRNETSDQERENSMQLCERYLTQLEFNLNNHVPYESELAKIEKLLSEQQANQLELEKLAQKTNNNTNDSSYLEKLEAMMNIDDSEIKREKIIVINPKWQPLTLASDELTLLNKFKQAAEMEREKNGMENSQEVREMFDQFLLKPMYSTLLFGLSNDNNQSLNYEQCLSVPNIMCEKVRYNRIKTSFYDRDGKERRCYLKSMDSRLFQHECDHLKGVLMTDSVYENMWDKCIYIDEYARQENDIYKPTIEKLLSELSVEDQNKLYQFYDPLHPPTSSKLIAILKKLIEATEESKQELKQRGEEAMQESPNKHLLPEQVFE